MLNWYHNRITHNKSIDGQMVSGISMRTSFHSEHIEKPLSCCISMRMNSQTMIGIVLSFFPFHIKDIRDVSKWSAKMREPMEKVYGVEYFPQLWSEWIDAMVQLFEKNNGDICKNLLRDIEAKTLIVHGAKDPMVLAEHIPFLRKSIQSHE